MIHVYNHKALNLININTLDKDIDEEYIPKNFINPLKKIKIDDSDNTPEPQQAPGDFKIKKKFKHSNEHTDLKSLLNDNKSQGSGPKALKPNLDRLNINMVIYFIEC